MYFLHTFTFTVRRKSDMIALAVCTPDCSLFTCSPDIRVHFILCSPSNSFVFIPLNQRGNFSLIVVNTFPGNQHRSCCRIFSGFGLVQECIKGAVSDKSSSLISLYLSSSSSMRTLFSGHSLLIVLVSHLHTHTVPLSLAATVVLRSALGVRVLLFHGHVITGRLPTSCHNPTCVTAWL